MAADPLLGMVIDDRYKVEALIGKGAVGSVYRARQELLGRVVALKVLHGYLGADPESLVRFHREAKALSRLEHPHLLTLYDFGTTPDGQPFFVMDLLEGKTLANLIEQEAPLSIERTVAIFQQVCEALSEAHKKGVVHRDIKPGNIVVMEKEDIKEFVKLVDFSIAKISETGSDPVQLTVDGVICGSPAYMSPEQCRGGQVDRRSDIYSLAIVLFEALTGQRPFAAKDLVSLMYMHVNDEPALISEVAPERNFPAALVELVDRSLSKDPDKRPQTVEQFITELKRACGDGGTSIPAQAISPSNPESVPQTAAMQAQKTMGAKTESELIRVASVQSIHGGKLRATVEAAAGAVAKEGINPTTPICEGEAASFVEARKSLQAGAETDAGAHGQRRRKEEGASQAESAHLRKVAQEEAEEDRNVQSSRRGKGIGTCDSDQAPPITRSPYAVPTQQRERGATYDAASHATDVAFSYRSFSTALRQILPLIILLAVAGFGILAMWDVVTPDTPQELFVKERFDDVIAVLEPRRRAGHRLSESDQEVLDGSYINVAKALAHNRKYAQAIQLLRKVSRNSKQAATADALMSNWKRLSPSSR
ncbi:MAG TPA: serine/threonine-protein kinase [Candidatus Obscuribacterales bacterium]